MRLLWIVLTTLLVVAAAAAPLLLWKAEPTAPAPSPSGGAPAGLADEEHYYVFLTVLEVEAKDRGGSSWDAAGPPDLFYAIRWQGEQVFQSSVKGDTLVAKWSNVSLELGDVMESVSIDDSIKAARITARPGSVLEFLVYDRDRVSPNDLVGSWQVPVERLELGDQKWERPGGRVVSAQCRVLPIDGVRFETLTR